MIIGDPDYHHVDILVMAMKQENIYGVDLIFENMQSWMPYELQKITINLVVGTYKAFILQKNLCEISENSRKNICRFYHFYLLDKWKEYIHFDDIELATMICILGDSTIIDNVFLIIKAIGQMDVFKSTLCTILCTYETSVFRKYDLVRKMKCLHEDHHCHFTYQSLLESLAGGNIIMAKYILENYNINKNDEQDTQDDVLKIVQIIKGDYSHIPLKSRLFLCKYFKVSRDIYKEKPNILCQMKQLECIESSLGILHVIVKLEDINSSSSSSSSTWLGQIVSSVLQKILQFEETNCFLEHIDPLVLTLPLTTKEMLVDIKTNLDREFPNRSVPKFLSEVHSCLRNMFENDQIKKLLAES